jgi:tetratricopeptide (TPR) repeat protein
VLLAAFAGAGDAAAGAIPSPPPPATEQGRALALATTLVPADVVPLAREDVLALTPEMREWLHSQVPSTLPPTDRLNLLVRRLQATDGGALRYDAWFTASAAEAFAAHRFNCLSFSHLVVAMARELGLRAYYIEARYRQRYDREGDLVLLAGHITVGWGDSTSRWVVEFGNEARLDTARVRELDDVRALAMHYANLGAAELRRGNPEKALSALATAIDVDPRAAGAWVNLGVALRRRGDPAAAEAAYRRAIAADPEMVPGWANLYSILRTSGRGREASALVADIMDLNNRDPWLLLAMGEECMGARDFACASRLFKRARAEAHDEAAPAAALAVLALAQGDQAKARKWVRRAEELDPREPRLFRVRAALGLPQPPVVAKSEPTRAADTATVVVPPTPDPPNPNR